MTATTKKSLRNKSKDVTVVARIKYSDELATKICEKIADGQSLRTIGAQTGMPCMQTICKWLGEHDDFAEQYARARELQADKYAQEIIAIADDGINDTYIDDDGKVMTDHDVIARSRLRVDARKWYASKLAPKKYGDRQIVDAKVDAAIQIDTIQRIIVDKV